MKHFLTGLAVTVMTLFMVSAMIPTDAQARGSRDEKVWWITGTIKGSKARQQVITLKLVRKGEPHQNAVSVTSTNKFNQYAFSRPEGGGTPSAYRLVLFVGLDQVMEVPLDGVKSGGRVPPISVSW